MRSTTAVFLLLHLVVACGQQDANLHQTIAADSVRRLTPDEHAALLGVVGGEYRIGKDAQGHPLPFPSKALRGLNKLLGVDTQYDDQLDPMTIRAIRYFQYGQRGDIESSDMPSIFVALFMPLALPDSERNRLAPIMEHAMKDGSTWPKVTGVLDNHTAIALLLNKANDLVARPQDGFQIGETNLFVKYREQDGRLSVGWFSQGPLARYDKDFYIVGTAMGLPPALLKAIAMHEGILSEATQNGAGDLGVMQLNVATWARGEMVPSYPLEKLRQTYGWNLPAIPTSRWQRQENGQLFYDQSDEEMNRWYLKAPWGIRLGAAWYALILLDDTGAKTIASQRNGHVVRNFRAEDLKNAVRYYNGPPGTGPDPNYGENVWYYYQGLLGAKPVGDNSTGDEELATLDSGDDPSTEGSVDVSSTDATEESVD